MPKLATSLKLSCDCKGIILCLRLIIIVYDVSQHSTAYKDVQQIVTGKKIPSDHLLSNKIVTLVSLPFADCIGYFRVGHL